MIGVTSMVQQNLQLMKCHSWRLRTHRVKLQELRSSLRVLPPESLDPGIGATCGTCCRGNLLWRKREAFGCQRYDCGKGRWTPPTFLVAMAPGVWAPARRDVSSTARALYRALRANFRSLCETPSGIEVPQSLIPLSLRWVHIVFPR